MLGIYFHSFISADLRTLHKFNEEGKIVSPRSDPAAYLQSQGAAGLPQDSPVLAALGGDLGLKTVENAAIQQSPRGSCIVVFLSDRKKLCVVSLGFKSIKR